MTQIPKASRLSLGASAAVILLSQGALLSACNNDETFITVEAEMELEPASGAELEFETVVLGEVESSPRTFIIRNVGTDVLDLSNLTVEGPGADAYQVTSFPQRLGPGQEREVFVRFVPGEVGEHDATLSFQSNDADNPSGTYTLSGLAKDPCNIALSPGHSPLLLGEERELTLENISTSDCEITRLFVDRSLFGFVDPPELPFTLPAGQIQPIVVTHTAVNTTPGVPVREVLVKESRGKEATATVSGEPPVYGCFTVFPERELSFPRTDVGFTVQRSVRVTNECDEEAAITSVGVPVGFYYFDVDREQYPVMVPPFGEHEVVVSYTAFSPLGDLGRLRVNTNDAQNPSFEINLRGEAAVPQVEVFPQALDFGTVVFRNPAGPVSASECGSRSKTVTVYSTGDSDVVVDRLEVDADGDQQFLIASVLIDGQPVADFNQPMTVPSGSQMDIAMQFYPVRRTPAGHESTLRIHHNVGDGFSEVGLVGDGTDDGATTDIFNQLEGPKVDILWVIDDSCSMYDEQARLISNLSNFVGYADSQNADYQMAVTVTDARSSRAGKFERCFPHPAIIDSDYGQGQQNPGEIRGDAFRCTFEVGTTGSGAYEAGLGAAKRALERATAPGSTSQNNINHGFVRDDANLAVVVMSDEEDQTGLSLPVLKDFFESVKGRNRPDRSAVHAIAGPTSEPCVVQGRFQAQPGFRYEWMATETGGLFNNICDEDWSPALTQLGLDVFVPLDEWNLSQAADPGSVVVTVDGVSVPFDAQDGYTYNPVANSVKFHGDAVPDPGAQIVVEYLGLCRP